MKMNWIIVITLFHISTQTTILIDHNGSNTLSCCASFQSCPCSNLSLALEIVKNGTEIKLMSDISLMYVTRFGNISNVTITGHDHSIQCNHQGGLVGENIGSIAIQGVMWDHCRGVSFENFNDVCIFNCTFQHSVASYALKLVGHDSIFIGNSTFSFNNGAVSSNALSIDIHHCRFYNNGFGEALNIAGFTSYPVNVTLTDSVFTSNSGPSLFCDGNSQISIDNSHFVNNFYSAVVLKKCLMLVKDITFNDNTVTISNSTYCGAAIYSSHSTLNISGSAQFLSNKALHKGGAIYLLHSAINIIRGLVRFNQNTADMGGAIYVDLNSNISVYQNTVLKFTNNSALYGGALYISIADSSHYKNVIMHYYNLLMTLTYFQSNTAKNSGSLAYFQYEFVFDCIPIERSIKHRNLFSTPPCKVTIFDFLIKANASDYDYKSHTVSIWIENLKFSAIIMDFFNNFAAAHNVTVSICDSQPSPFKYTIDTIHNDQILLEGNTITSCYLYGQELTITVISSVAGAQELETTIQWEGQNCTDILHYDDNYECQCQLLTCQDLKSSENKTIYAPPGFRCHQGSLAVIPGYWYDNGLNKFVISCPPEFCNFIRWSDGSILSQPFPDRDLQCKKNWRGFSCGKCDHNDNYFIKYGSTDCITHTHCSISSTPLSLLVLFLVSFVYWCLVIAFIFVLLHFRFNVIAGYAFGIIFYYSVLAQVVGVLDKVNQLRYCAITEDLYAYECSLPQDYVSIILPFLFSIGTLKPPFMQYLKLCLGGTEMVDHIVLDYIHPLIVFTIVAIIFVCSRKFVWAARLFGRYINSKSICLLILLSYSSISYTSLQLLRPLAYFKYDGIFMFSTFSGLKPYWSPHIDYFDSFHSYYVILALLMVVLVGFGFPFLLLFQRYLTRRHNMNFTSIQPIIDQLQACYRNDCYWFSTYYLICRQVIYGVDIVCDFLFVIFMQNEEYTFAKFIILLVLSILILAIHLMFQPYRLKSLNILDGVILLTLVLLLVASLDGNSFLASVLFWVLPLIIFINYLAYSTKAQHFVVFSSVCGLIVLLHHYFIFIGFFAIDLYEYVGIVFNLCLLLLLSILVGYTIYVLKKIKKVCACTPRNSVLAPAVNYMQIDSDESSEDDDD